MSIADSVFHSRAVRTMGIPIADDPEPMVQQQLARLLFFSSILPVKGKRILEFGCGSGLNCAFFKESQASRAVGFDFSRDSVDLARQQHPGMEFLVGDGCDSGLAIEPGTWDLVVSFEVLEHVPDQEKFVANMRRHVAPNGSVFISTPNRDVFSLGHEPSPMNREHLKELNEIELRSLLQRHFSGVELYGQRFGRTELQVEWDRDVRAKIQQLKMGTRWVQHVPASARWASKPIVRQLYGNATVRRAWRYFRWNLLYTFEQRRAIAHRPYGYKDFEFSADLSGALWFCASLRN